MYIFEISTKRRIFDAPFDLFKEKKVLSLRRDNECLERQPSRFINIVGKDDISRQGEKPDR